MLPQSQVLKHPLSVWRAWRISDRCRYIEIGFFVTWVSPYCQACWAVVAWLLVFYFIAQICSDVPGPCLFGLHLAFGWFRHEGGWKYADHKAVPAGGVFGRICVSRFVRSWCNTCFQAFMERLKIHRSSAEKFAIRAGYSFVGVGTCRSLASINIDLIHVYPDERHKPTKGFFEHLYHDAWQQPATAFFHICSQQVSIKRHVCSVQANVHNEHKDMHNACAFLQCLIWRLRAYVFKIVSDVIVSYLCWPLACLLSCSSR